MSNRHALSTLPHPSLAYLLPGEQRQCRNINLLSIAFGACLRLRTD